MSRLAVLLDFDGPICTFFVSPPLPTIAATLRYLLESHGVTVPDTPQTRHDPLTILRFAANLGRPELTCAVEDGIRTAERHAVRTATPTPGATEALAGLRREGVDVVIVSNNSSASVTAYLALHGLTDHVVGVVGREYARPELMKPNPIPLQRAAALTGAAECILVGDTVSDVQAAAAAGIPCIGYVPDSTEPFAAAGADKVIRHMAELEDALAGFGGVHPAFQAHDLR